MGDEQNLFGDVLLRLQALEAEKQVRLCMNKYMAFCDELDVDFELSALMALFSKDAVWQGLGNRYAKTYGCYEGREAIANMFAGYISAPAHFNLNAHFLCNELIHVDVISLTAAGRWMLIQTSTFGSGKSQLSCAKISAEFVLENQVWQISSFKTQNLFSRPMAAPWDSSASLAVPTKASSANKNPPIVKEKSR
jgi:hypothetical protein